MTNTLLELKQLGLSYGYLEVVQDINLYVAKGQLVGLIGGNGSGKSSILKAISGMLKPSTGQIYFEGKTINALKVHVLSERGIAHVTTEKHLFLSMTVEDNLLLGAYLDKAKKQRKATLERVYKLFPDLWTRRKDTVSLLSGGQRQMLAVARALMSQPKLLMIDEPSQGLAPQLVRTVLEAVQELVKEGLSALIVEQNVREILSITDRAYVLEQGSIVLDGPSSDLLGNSRIKKVYLGL